MPSSILGQNRLRFAYSLLTIVYVAKSKFYSFITFIKLKLKIKMKDLLYSICSNLEAIYITCILTFNTYYQHLILNGIFELSLLLDQ